MEITRGHRMELDEYQELAIRTEPFDLPLREQIAMAALGLSDEAGEVSGLAKKDLFHPHKKITREMYVDEMGDVLWYLACLAHVLDIKLSEIAVFNVAKLAKRYPQGFPRQGEI